jgi:hypothetical protein
MLIGVSVGMSIFLWIYFTSINGFYRLEVNGDTIRLHYALPSRTYTLHDEIARIESAYASRWGGGCSLRRAPARATRARRTILAM